MVVFAQSIASPASHVRPFNIGRDLKAATDLVELCFADTLDPDGQRYLRRLHDSAHRSWFDWGDPFNEPAALPLGGYVWEENNRLAGYLSIMPFQNGRERCYLIANVAVDPEYRGRGIGRMLTLKALEYTREHRAAAAWLQVRSDNPAAVHIYQVAGFHERTRRTTWVCEHPSADATPNWPFNIAPRHNLHWPVQRGWLDRLYPPDLAWHLPLDRRLITPGLTGGLYRFFTLVYPRHWVAQLNKQILGIVTHIPTEGYADSLWLATPADSEPFVMEALLRCARRQVSRTRPLTLNFPADTAAEAIESAGFRAQQTLLWMEYRV